MSFTNSNTAYTKPMDVSHLYVAKIINAITIGFLINLDSKVGSTGFGSKQLGQTVSSGCTGLLHDLQLAIY